MTSVPYHHDVGSVPETLRKRQVSARPPARFFLYPEMQSSARVRPGVITIVQVVQSSPIARNGANSPLVSAELKWLCGRELRRTNALDNG